MPTVKFDIYLHQPLLATSLDGDPNSSSSYDFIPGSALRGALASRYIEKNGMTDVVRWLFFSDQVCFLNAYPFVWNESAGNMQPAWPLPLSWRYSADDVETIYDQAIAPASVQDKLKALHGFSDYYFTVAIGQPDRRISIHTQRHRDFGRARRNSGAVFQYDALDAGQTLRGALVYTLDASDPLMTEKQKAIETIVSWLDGDMHLGGSRTAGYGSVRLSVVRPSEEEDAQWAIDKAVEPSKPVAGDAPLIILLLSDLLLRDKESGQWTTDPRDVAKALDLELITAYTGTRSVGGFNRTWNLPLVQRTAFQMGSVFVCRLPTHDDAKSIKTVLTALGSGLGEGRNDGFGRIAVNWQQEAVLARSKADQAQPEPVALSENTPVADLARQMVGRMLRQRIEAQAIARANVLAQPWQSINKSQLHRLRLILRPAIEAARAFQQALQGDSVAGKDPDAIREQVNTYLGGLEKRASTRRQFERARIDDEGKRLLIWIKARVDEKLGADKVQNPSKLQLHDLPKVGDVSATWSDALLLEANLLLVDAVMAAAAKLKRE